MKRLFLALVAVCLVYGSYWFYAANSLQKSIESWFEDQRTAGWHANYSDITVRGFPSRTDVTLTDVDLQAPDGKTGWNAPFFQVLGLSYKNGHVIVAWPEVQTVTTPEGPFVVTSDGLRASLIYDGDLVLRSNLEATSLTIAGPEENVALAGVNAAIEKVEPAAAQYRLALALDGLARSDPALSGTLVPDAFASFRTESVVELDEPLTLENYVSATPSITGVETRLTQIDYGALTFKVTGDAQFDEQGRASGEVTLEAENWRQALATAQEKEDLPPNLAEGIADVLSLVATLSGGRDTLDVTLGLDNGRVLLGPLPIGQLPPLRFP